MRRSFEAWPTGDEIRGGAVSPAFAGVHGNHMADPGAATPFVPGFHLDAIAEHLEAITRGQIRKLLINIPQRHMKSPGLAGHQ